ncbi:MAG: DNA polymerase III subunit beta [Gammaproteobacteria bacterium]|nr:DNA polymerase III subunit beta [Gammaproteobacteria bacterium]
MKISTTKTALLDPLQQVGGVVERRQTLPILANILLNLRGGSLLMTATDLEVEMKTSIQVDAVGEIDITLPARKLIDICRALPDGVGININVEGERVTIVSGPSRFSLGTLPAKDYPVIEPSLSNHRFSVSEKILKSLIEKTQFAMAQQDVRYYLNGMLLEIKEGKIRSVSTDGHRLATSEKESAIDNSMDLQVIIPRKAILELGKLLSDSDDLVQVDVSSNHVQVKMSSTIFTSKLVDGKFPDYKKVIPKFSDKTVFADRVILRDALQRTSILSNEKYRGIRFQFSNNMLELLAHNPEQEEAKEELEIEYQGDELVIGFNVGYLIEVLTVLETKRVKLMLSDSNSSCLIEDEETSDSRYVIMPMRL